MAKASVSQRRPRLAVTIQLAEAASISPAEAKKILVETVNRIPASKLKGLRAGQLTLVL